MNSSSLVTKTRERVPSGIHRGSAPPVFEVRARVERGIVLVAQYSDMTVAARDVCEISGDGNGGVWDHYGKYGEYTASLALNTFGVFPGIQDLAPGGVCRVVLLCGDLGGVKTSLAVFDRLYPNNAPLFTKRTPQEFNSIMQVVRQIMLVPDSTKGKTSLTCRALAVDLLFWLEVAHNTVMDCTTFALLQTAIQKELLAKDLRRTGATAARIKTFFMRLANTPLNTLIANASMTGRIPSCTFGPRKSNRI